MRHFLFEEREYKMQVNFKGRKDYRDSARELSKLLHTKSSKGGNGTYINKSDARQKCVIKMQYSKNLSAHKVQLEKYLIREGSGIDGERAKLFGTDIEEYREHMVAKNFKIFLSPQSSKTDLKALAETFVKKLELQTGFKLYWEGACHYNTAHPHAHLLINGVDKNGREVIFPKDVVRTFMRESARDICTVQLGSRTRKEMEIEKEKELSSPRFTKLDLKIKELCGSTFVKTSELKITESEKQKMNLRMETLRQLKLCKYQDGGYRMAASWEEQLKNNGRYNVFLRSRDTLPQGSTLRMYTGAQGSISGTVHKVYRTDGDASDNHAVVVQAKDGQAFFVPLMKQPEITVRGAKKLLREGDVITLKTYETQSGRLTPVILSGVNRQQTKGIER
ncbi:MAG: hypothetical protein Ta2G_17860 [Termitinemataceae bacterium]|nr:MAG: hypothetical protein Ta2G_17860 [Termitinemataceae bacterium]